MEVTFEISREMPMVAPMTDEVGRQRHDEGREVGAHHNQTVDQPDQCAGEQCQRHHRPDRQAEMLRPDRDDHRGGADRRTDGQIELTGNHQDADRGRDDAELGGEVKPAERAVERDEAGPGGDHCKEGVGQDERRQCAEFRPADDCLEEGSVHGRSISLTRIAAQGFVWPGAIGPASCGGDYRHDAPRTPLYFLLTSSVLSTFVLSITSGPVVTAPIGCRP